PCAAREKTWRFDRGRGGANRLPCQGLVKLRGGLTGSEHERADDLGVRATVDDGARRSTETDLFDEAGMAQLVRSNLLEVLDETRPGRPSEVSHVLRPHDRPDPEDAGLREEFVSVIRHAERRDDDVRPRGLESLDNSSCVVLSDRAVSFELRRTLESDLALAVPAKSRLVDARLPANRLGVEEGDASVFNPRRHVRVVPPSVQDVAVDDTDGERARRLREHGDVLPAASPAPRRLGSNPGRGLHDGLRKFLPWPWIEPASEATSRDIEEQGTLKWIEGDGGCLGRLDRPLQSDLESADDPRGSNTLIEQ